MTRFCVCHLGASRYGRLKHAGDFSIQWTDTLPVLLAHRRSRLSLAVPSVPRHGHPLPTSRQLCPAFSSASHTLQDSQIQSRKYSSIHPYTTPLRQQKETSSYQQNIEKAGDSCRPLVKRDNREASGKSEAFSLTFTHSFKKTEYLRNYLKVLRH